MKRLLKLTICMVLLWNGVAQGQMDFDAVPDKVIVHADDVVIQGSECVGFDCTNAESFGSDTQRLKENNLRIHFDDTSNSASFPSNDWRLVANDQINGGDNFFSIDDATAGTQVFRVDAGAGNNALRITSSGNVGIGTATPVLELQITDGDSPALRLEQNGSSGFSSQTWDVAGNETNFFVRDVTNASKLPFVIKPNAPTNSLFIAADGNVGIGTSNPASKMDVLGDGQFNGSLNLYHTDTNNLELEMGNTNAASVNVTLRMENIHQKWILQNRKNGNYRLRNETSKTTPLQVAYSDNDITAAGDITANGVLLTSDLRLKKDVEAFKDGLNVVRALNPISYKFNERSGYLSDRTYYSISAQELQDAAPYLVHKFKLEDKDENESEEDYLKIDFGAIPWLLVNAVKEQQEQLDAKDELIDDLKTELDELKDQVQEIKEFLNERYNTQDLTIEGDNAVLFQNYPNPHNGQTVIEYQIPERASSAELHIYNVQGQLLETITLSTVGKGKVNINSSDLPAGRYSYSLYVDGSLKDSKQMTIVE